MTSKTSLHKLLRFELKRSIWLYALTLLFLLFVQPISLLTRIESTAWVTASEWQEILTNFFLYQFGAKGVEMIVIAFVYGMFFYSFVYSRPATDLYHSLGIRREQLFGVKYLAALLPILVMQLISWALCLVVLAGKSMLSRQLLALSAYSLLVNMIGFLMGINLMIIAIMLTGIRILGVFGALILVSFANFASILITGYKSFCYQTYYANATDSPLWEYLVNPLSIMQLCTEDYASQICTAIILLAEAIAFGVVALVLYQKRPSEKSGTALCYQLAKPIIRIPLVMFVALAGGLYNSFFANSLNAAWFWSSLIISGVLGHLILELIYEHDMKKLFAHPVQLAVGLAASIAVAVFFIYDCGGYDRYLPNTEKVAGVSVKLLDIENEVSPYEWNNLSQTYQYTDSENYFMNNVNLSDIDTVLSLASMGVDQLNPVTSAFARQEQSENGTGEYNPYQTNYLVCFHMNSGANVYRYYRCDINQVMEQFSSIYESSEYKSGLYQLPMFNEKNLITVLEARDSDGNLCFDSKRVDVAGFMEAYQKDLQARQLTDLKSYPILRLSSYDSISYNDYLSGYYVLESDANTIAYLSAQGIKIDDYKFNVAAQDIKKIKITDYNTEPGEAYHENITELIPEENGDVISRLAPILVPGAYTYNNSVLHPSANGIDVEVTYTGKNNTESTIYCSLPYGTELDL